MSHARIKPIARFLGEEEAAGGPFALLGVSPRACTDELVLSGLDRQVERVNLHAECDTPEADEVRLALHAAAAQLLDPVVRRHLIMRWGGVTPLRPAAPAMSGKAPAAPVNVTRPTQPVAAKPMMSSRLLEADAILTLGLFGGWNQRSLRRLLTLAHRRGMGNAQVAETLRNLSRRRAGGGRAKVVKQQGVRRPTSRLHTNAPAANPTARAVSSGPVAEAHSVQEMTPFRPLRREVDPAQRLLRNAIIFGFLGIVGLSAAVTGIIIAVKKQQTTVIPPVVPNPVAKLPPPTPERPDPPAPDPLTIKPKPLPPAPDASDLVAIPREIGACAEALSIDPVIALTRFETAINKLAVNWMSIPKDRLIASHDAVVEFLYRANSTPEVPGRAIQAIAKHAAPLGSAERPGAADVPPATWAMGMLTRLGKEKDLSATTKVAIDQELVQLLGQNQSGVDQSFEAGAAAALNVWPQRLTPTGAAAKTTAIDLDSWKAWILGVEALAGPDSPGRLRFLLSGLETLLVQGPEPNENRTVGPVVVELVTKLSWRAEDESRRWLLRWFGDQRISTADLNSVTSALATKSRAEGVDLTMVLSTSASENTRADLRERYATVWGVQNSLARDALVTDWSTAAKDAINASFASISETDDFALAIVLLRLNDAAWWQWRGDGAEAASLVADIKGPVEQAMSMPEVVKGGDQMGPDLSDGAWAEKYLAAKTSPKLRRELIDQISRSTKLGATDAEVLAGEALTGAPADLRTAAQEALKKFGESATVLNALLERLPKVPKGSSAASDLISVIAMRPLPGARDPDWPIAARRALVERLLEALAAESPRVRIDRLSVLLAGSYRSMVAASPLPPDQRAARIQPPAHQSAAELWRKWRLAADALVPSTPPPIPLDQLDRRRSGRLSQARGMVQAFAAEQTSIAEAMAYVVTAEQPAQVDKIRLVLTNMATDRRHATNVLEQIKIAERAITQLWMIRMQQETGT